MVVYKLADAVVESSYIKFKTNLGEKLNGYYRHLYSYLLKEAQSGDLFIYLDNISAFPPALDEESFVEYLNDLDTFKEENSKAIKELESSFKEDDLARLELPEWLADVDNRIRDLILEIPKTHYNSSLIDLEKGIRQENRSSGGEVILFKDGTLEYYSPRGRIYSCPISQGTNEYRLLLAMAKQVGTIIPSGELSNAVKKRKTTFDFDPKAAVKDTVDGIRKKLGFDTRDSMFLTGGGGYGLRYPLTLKE